MPEPRAEYHSKSVTVLTCMPGNLNHAEGESASIITVARTGTGEIEPLVISLADSRTLVVRLLMSLWTAEDSFAEQVLTMFSLADDGVYHWPKVSD